MFLLNIKKSLNKEMNWRNIFWWKFFRCSILWFFFHAVYWLSIFFPDTVKFDFMFPNYLFTKHCLKMKIFQNIAGSWKSVVINTTIMFHTSYRAMIYRGSYRAKIQGYWVSFSLITLIISKIFDEMSKFLQIFITFICFCCFGAPCCA